MSLSSNSVIHYTKSLENLKGILREQKFYLKYCTDYVRVDNVQQGQFELAVPMVSFCDIPFTEVNELANEENYGCYGIGLSKKWATAKRLNPVLYCDSKSNLTQIIDSIYYLSNAISGYTEEDHTLYRSKELLYCCEELLGYVKNYQNLPHKVGKIPAKYRFYDEREWRYVPTKSDINGDLDLLLEKSKFLNNKDFYNEKAKHYSLTFEEKDITYIVVKNKCEIHDMLTFLNDIHIKTPELCTKIISLEQIKKDF